MKKFLFNLLAIIGFTVCAIAQPISGSTGSLGKITKMYTAPDGCNTVTCYESGWCASTAMYCGPSPLTLGKINRDPQVADALEVQIPEDATDGGWGWLIVPPAIRQTQMIGLTFKTDIEGQGSGNSTIMGMGIESAHHIKSIDLVNSFSLTWDKKGYLNRFGVAPRLHTKARWHLPMKQDDGRFFLQAGFNAAAVQYGGEGGYAKYGFQPSLGFGFDFSPSQRQYDLVGSFAYNFHSPLWGQASLTNSTGKVKDGWTVGQTYKVENFTPIKPGSKWGFIANVQIDRTTYTRNTDVYGPVLGGVPHRFVTVGLSLGIGRKY